MSEEIIIEVGDLVRLWAYQGQVNEAFIGIVITKWCKGQQAGQKGWEMVEVFTPDGVMVVASRSCRIISKGVRAK